MSDTPKKFHEIALESDLFKGHSDWYFCYLKAEKIAHVFAVLCDKSPFQYELEVVVDFALEVPRKIVFFAAGNSTVAEVLADIFAVLSVVRVSATRGHLHKDNALIIVREYENIIEKITVSNRLPSFLSSEDFVVPQIEQDQKTLMLSTQVVDFGQGESRKEVKGHQVVKDKQAPTRAAQEDRGAAILDFVRKNKNVSIKDISAVVRDCSEKTIQRELALLIQRGLVQKVGERRWSVYIPVPQS